MSLWFTRLRGALGMGIVWAIGWAVIGGGIMEGVVDPRGEILDMWPQTLAVPGFLVGVVFSGLVVARESRRRFDELSLTRFAGTGALAGAALGAAALAAGIFPGIESALLRAGIVLGPLTLLSAASASGTYLLARRAHQRLGAGADDARLAGSDATRQLGA
ncbi:MAG: hypothetical protein LCH84_00460 [Gemmatimonadetes bacterium]|nr:hypothetical protein [Gemmatimonadota bacterium]